MDIIDLFEHQPLFCCFTILDEQNCLEKTRQLDKSSKKVFKRAIKRTPFKGRNEAKERLFVFCFFGLNASLFDYMKEKELNE